LELINDFPCLEYDIDMYFENFRIILKKERITDVLGGDVY